MKRILWLMVVVGSISAASAQTIDKSGNSAVNVIGQIPMHTPFDMLCLL